MQEQIQLAEKFFSKEVPQLLEKLEADTKALWGMMTAQHMIEHLIVIYKISIGRISIPVLTKPEEQDRIKAYLMKDSPMKRSVPLPNGKQELQPLRAANLEEAKEKLLKEIKNFESYRAESADQLMNHPYGGPMLPSQWFLFHRKHIKHHFIQFGLIPDYES